MECSRREGDRYQIARLGGKEKIITLITKLRTQHDSQLSTDLSNALLKITASPIPHTEKKLTPTPEPNGSEASSIDFKVKLWL